MPMVLGVLLVIAIISVAFASLVSVRQRLAGHRYRVLVARYLAEGAVEQALWALENDAQNHIAVDGVTHIQAGGILEGKFSVEKIRDEGKGLVSILASGEVGGVLRRVRTTARLSPRILTYALFGNRLIRLEGSEARTYVIPAYPSSACVEGGHLGTSGEIWFRNPGASVNEFTGAVLPLREGDRPDHALVEAAATAEQPNSKLGKLTLAGGAVLTIGEAHLPTDARGLRANNIWMGMEVLSIRDSQVLPVVDHDMLRALAQASVANAEINEAVGDQTWPALRMKRDSVYEQEDFRHIIQYLAGVPSKPLKGPIYVKGTVTVPEDTIIQLLDGFLAVEGSLTIRAGGHLEVRHSSSSRTFPGIVTMMGEARPLIVQQRGVLIVDGLVYAGGPFDADQGSIIDIVGALMGADARLSIRNHNATLVIRYDPSVLGTVALIRPPGTTNMVAEIVSWEEVP